MRKLFAPLIMSLFFFLPLKVYGASYTVTLDSSLYSIFEEPGFCEFYHTIVDTNPYYIFVVQNKVSSGNSNLLYRYNTTLFSSTMTGVASWGGGIYGLTYNSNPSSNAFYWTWFNVPGFTVANGDGQQYTLYQSTADGSLTKNFSFPIASSLTYVTSGSNIYTINIGNDSLTFGAQQTIKNAPTLLDMYKISHSDPTICSVTPPTPTDDFPILTSFYSLFLEKVGELTEFFTSSYVYLSVFVIILFYIVLLLFWRFLK